MSRALASGSSVSKQSWVRALQDYLHQSSLPLASLVFIALPLIIYELGSRKVLAEKYFKSFFTLLGAQGGYLPALGVVSVLLAWHISRKDPWKIPVITFFSMSAESILLAIPLVALSGIVNQYAPMSTLGDNVILSMGAGIYEEFAFRLFGLTLLTIILVDLFKMDKNRATFLMIALSAVTFALYHYLREPFAWDTLIFRTLAGAYFSSLFFFRGFGITAGAHICYNIFCVFIRP